MLVNPTLAQVVTDPTIYLPFNENNLFIPQHSVEARGHSAALPGKLLNVKTVELGNLVENRFKVDAEAVRFDWTMPIAVQDNTPISFFGTNSATGHDTSAITISCWVYVDPKDMDQQYLFYGKNQQGEIGFGLSRKGQDLFLTKFINDSSPQEGAPLINTIVGDTWEGKLWGPAGFNASNEAGWYQVILVQDRFYTRVFVGMAPNGNSTDGKGITGKFNKDFVGSMVMHGKQNLSSFTHWGLGSPSAQSGLAIDRIDDFMVFEYAMTPAQAEALYRCQVDNSVTNCFGVNPNFNQSFAIIGDYGCDGGNSSNPLINNPVAKVATMVDSWNPNYILSVGDDSYHDNSQCSDSIDHNVGKYYHKYIYPYQGSHGSGSLDSANRFFPVMGNHDYHCPGDPTINCPAIWSDYFPTQTLNNSNNANGRYYSFKKGNIEFFALNSNKQEPNSNHYRDSLGNLTVQGTWLKNAMEQSTALFKVVYMHHPPYSSFKANHGGSNIQDVMKKWPFKELGADIIIGGDHHFYERSEFQGRTYLVAGVSGFPGLSSRDSTLQGSQQYVEQNFGALKVDANNEMMRFQFYTIDHTAASDRSKDKLRDEFFIYKRSDGSTYRLETNNKDSSTSEESSLSTDLDPQEFILYPNPIQESFTMGFVTQLNEDIFYRLLDQSGKIVQQNAKRFNEGNQRWVLKLNQPLAPGVYHIQVQSSSWIENRRLIIE